jgi:multidrug resistance efflux pump
MLRRSGLKASDTEDIVDEEEFKLMKELREAKRAYKNGYEQLQRCKQAISQAQMATEAAKTDFAGAFSNWSARNGGAGGGDFGISASPLRTTTMPMQATATAGLTGGSEHGSVDQLDDQEAFDRMEEERILASDPDSLAFFHAQKTRRAHMTQNAGTIRQMQKNKRTF